ncbi:MAG: glycosyltransferase family 2 protein [Bacteroidetes bacterium]|nr:glycosyltransferase family 2 protein [Bacteroidota bacterium]
MISIIIINYNTFNITKQCIQSIIDNTRDVAYEIILVDNASTERNADVFKDIFPQIKLIKSPENTGFAKGNNLGIEQALGEIILLLNSDTYFNENVLSKALTKFNMLSNIGFLGVKMKYPNGRVQFTARKFRSIGWEILDLFRFIPFLMPYTVRARLMQGKYFKGDFDMECDWLNGAFLMFNKSILERLPGQKLDERFFMYGEDHLWGFQLKQLGLINYFFQGTSLIHINNASTETSKRIRLLQTIYMHELDIMRIRKGSGLYYVIFSLIYRVKEQCRIFIKSLFS